MNIEQRYGPQVKSDGPFTRKCRLLQSWYRIEVARQAECGPHERGGRLVGSSLVNGEQTGANFISPAAFVYAQERVAAKATNPDLKIEEYRLFNNMLSSQPMCFNLFSDLRLGLREGRPDATEVLTAVLAESRVSAVSSVEVEMVPRPTADYIDDKTAFDAAVLFTDSRGRPGLAAIETKYTDKLGTNRASKEDRKFALADSLGLFTDEGRAWYAEHGFDQVARNLLLTLAYARKHGIANAINYVVGPREDVEAPAAVDALKSRLAPAHRDRIIWLPLEEIVRRGLAVADGELAEHFMRFYRRYLDFNQIAHLLGSARTG